MKARTFGALGAIFLQITLILVVLLAVAFDRGFYTAEYGKLGVYESCGADSDTLENATDIVIDYLKGTTDTMEGEGLIDGEIRQIFGEDERSHMVDVKELFRLALIVLLAGGTMTIVFMLIAGRHKRETAQGALVGVGIFAVLLGAGLAWLAVDFNGAFMAFHHLLFKNGLWLMDARTQFMIRMFPSQFFEDMGMRIAMYTGIGVALEIFVICMTGFGGRKKQNGIQ